MKEIKEIIIENNRIRKEAGVESIESCHVYEIIAGDYKGDIVITSGSSESDAIHLSKKGEIMYSRASWYITEGLKDITTQTRIKVTVDRCE